LSSPYFYLSVREFQRISPRRFGEKGEGGASYQRATAKPLLSSFMLPD